MAEKVSIIVSLKDAATKSIGGIRGAFKGLTSSVKKFLSPQALAVAGLTALAAGAIKTIGALADLQTRMVNVGNLTGESRESVDQMTDSLVDLSRTLPQSVNNLADALFDVVSAGVPAAESIEFLEAAGKLATAGVTDTKTAVDGLTSVMNAFSLEASDATAISDKFFAAQQKGKTTIAELSSSIGAVAPIAAGMGVSFDELISKMSALTLNGIKTSEAATGLRATLSNLLKPSEQAAELAAQLGLDFNAQAVESKGLTAVLKDVIDKTGGSKTAMGQLFGSMEAVNSVLALSKNNFEALEQVQDAVTNSTGRTDEAFQQNMNTLNAQWQIIKNNTAALGKILLGWLIPVLTKTLEAFNSLFSGIQSGFRLAAKGAKWFTSIFKKESEAQTKISEESQDKQTKSKKDAELERLKNLQEIKAKEVEAIIAGNEDSEKSEKKKKKNILKIFKAELAEKEALRDIDEQEQIDMLERLLKAHNSSASSRMDAEIKIFELKKILRDREEAEEKEAAEKAKRLQEERVSSVLDMAQTAADGERDILKATGNFVKKMAKDDLDLHFKKEQAKLAITAAANWWNPLGWGAAAAIVTLEIIKNEAFSAIDRFADGGIVGGSAMIGDRNIIAANSREAVLTTEQQARFMRIADGQESGGEMSEQLSRIEAVLQQPQTVRFSNSDGLVKGVISREKRMLRTGQISRKG